MARPNPLRDPEFARQVAEAFVAGLSRPEMCELFGVKDTDTITRWRRDARVKSIAHKLIEDRVLSINRRVDGVIEKRLQDAENLTIRELIDIRREFVGGKLREQVENVDEDTVAQTMEAIESAPELLEELERVFASAASNKPG